MTSFTPPAVGTSKEFAGLALTPDGSKLVAADLRDGSIALIDPDNPAATYTVPIAPVTNNGNPSCIVGPLYVATTSTNQVLVVTGGMPGLACGPGGTVYVADLSTRSAVRLPPSSDCAAVSPTYVSATADGTKVPIAGDGIGFCIYDSTSRTYSSNNSYQTFGAEFSRDGNVAASGFVFTDGDSNVIGRVSKPGCLLASLGGSNNAQPNLLEPKLSDSGSLYYMAYPNFFDIVDVQHGILRIRFSLSETVNQAAAPIAIDSAGRMVFLLTNKGLTIVNFDEALLSIGWVDWTTVTTGTLVTVREAASIPQLLQW